LKRVEIVKDIGENEVEERPQFGEVVLRRELRTQHTRIARQMSTTHMQRRPGEDHAIRRRVRFELLDEPAYDQLPSSLEQTNPMRPTHLQLRFFNR
jgi:hypothetical protein